MVKLIEYELENGERLFVQSSGEDNPVLQAGSDSGHKIIKAEKSFELSLESIKSAAQTLTKKLTPLGADELGLRFGLLTTGELGNFAIGKVGVEANFEVTILWKKEHSSNPAKNPTRNHPD